MYKEHLGGQTAPAHLFWVPYPSISLLLFPKPIWWDLKQSPTKQNQVWGHGPGPPLDSPFLNGAFEPRPPPGKVESLCSCVLCLVAQLCLTLCNPMTLSLSGSSVHGIFQARILEWVAMSSSRGSSQPMDWTQVSCIAGGFFISWTTREAKV